MAHSDQFHRQAALLIRCIPLVAEETCFALKGGTAINLFVRDMPRLSVDIDLTYLPVADRAASLAQIDAAMKRIGNRIARNLRGARVTPARPRGDNAVTKQFVEAGGVRIKIEVTPVLRGCVYGPSIRATSPRVEEELGFAEMQVVSFPDLYAGKLVAALDRQHPRDLFDVRDLLANEGIDAALRKAFVVYALSHNRPLSEILSPARLDMAHEFQRGFEGMSAEPVTLDELYRTREELITEVGGKMPDEHRRFLVSFEEGEPNWGLLDVPGVEELPAVRWRLQNLAAAEPRKRVELVKGLRKAVGLSAAGY